ncbi:MAG: hypothetical protein K0S58_3302 [Nitrospira sp.]|nr:hypothetical protein [Nitrospira sp.]
MDAGRWPFNEESAGRGHITHQGMAGVILHPLTEVGIGMFVAVVVGSRQLVMNFQRSRKRRHREQHAGEEQGNRPSGFDLCVTMNHRNSESRRSGD